MTGARYEIEQDSNGMYFAVLYSSNGFPLCKTGKRATKAGVEKTIWAIKKNANADIADTTKQ